MTTTTQLTPNSQVVVSMTATTATAAFQIQPGNTSYWTASVSTSFTQTVNSSNKGNAVVTFTTGLTVTLTPQTNGAYLIVVMGNIIDSGDNYSLVGVTVGQYMPPG